MELNNIENHLLVEKFKEDLKARNYSSPQEMAKKVKEFLWWLEAKEVSELDKVKSKHVEGFVEYLQQRPNKRTGKVLSANTIGKFHQAINKFSKFLEKTKNISWTITPLQIEDDSEFLPNILTEEQVTLLFKATDSIPNYLIAGRDKALLALLFFGALRAQEAANLRLSDINLPARELLVLSTEGREIKTRTERRVPLTSQACQILQEYLVNVRPMLAGDNDYFIVSERGGKLDSQNFKLRIRELQKLTGNIELQSTTIRAHDLRGTFASLCAKKGLPLEQIKMMLGHKSTDSTQKYLFINRNSKK